jgi:23S rRNA pseudouridine955/2504/2580 synthase
MKYSKEKNVFLADEDQTIISFLKKIFATTPLSLLYKLFRTKKVKVNDKDIRYYQHRLKNGDIVKIEDNSLISSLKISKKKRKIRPEVDFEIMYEDDNILIAIKDHNIETHNDENPEKSLDNAVAYYLENSGWISQSQFFIVSSSHRLDKLTKGLVVYPKNPIAKKVLHESFGKKNLIKKEYLAVCENRKNKKIPVFFDGFIFKDDENERMIFQPESSQKKNEKSCSMTMKELSKNKNFAVLEIELKTGRKHQIRAMLSYLGFPIIGDKKYGSNFVLKDKIKLFGYKLEFINLPKPLDYLNGKKFEIKRIKDKIIYQINDSSENLLPKKFMKY